MIEETPSFSSWKQRRVERFTHEDYEIFMPYQVNAIRGQYKYQSIVPRRLLAYTIVKFLKELGLTLREFQDIVRLSQCNPHMIVSETEFNDMVKHQPGLDMIYDSMQLKDLSRVYYHTNWSVGKYSWRLMVDQLQKYQIEVTTIATPDLPVTLKTKEPLI